MTPGICFPGGTGIRMKHMKKTGILVTGGAGAVGMEVLGELVKSYSHLKIRAFDLGGKRARKSLKSFGNRIEVITGSINDYPLLEKAVEGMDIIIHLAAVIPPAADKNPALAWKVNVEGTRNLIRAAGRRSPDAFLLHTSSVSVYGDRVKNPWIQVEDELNPSIGDEYGRGKVVAEGIVRESGLRYSIFRLTGIMGPSQMKRKGIDPLFFHMPLNTSYEFATTRDAGFAISRVPFHLKELENRVFNLAGGESCRVTYRNFLKQSMPIIGLNLGEFPEEAFATRNFHCGYFKDSEKLEKILHFQRDSMDSYIRWISEAVPNWRKRLVKAGGKSIVRFMLKHSDPLRALREKNKPMVERFFRSPPTFSPAHSGC